MLDSSFKLKNNYEIIDEIPSHVVKLDKNLVKVNGIILWFKEMPNS